MVKSHINSNFCYMFYSYNYKDFNNFLFEVETTCLKKKYFVFGMRQKGIDFNHDFYVVVGKQCRTENAYTGHKYKIFI